MKTRNQLLGVLTSLAVLLLFCAAIGAPVPVQAQTVQVLSADPPSAAQGTVNLNVLIKGKGFKNGALAKFLVTGTDDPGGIKVNSTTFVSSTSVTANIDVTDMAVLSKFDIQVMNRDGRGGKGTELFSVTQKGGSQQAACPVLTPVLTSAASCTSTLAGCLDTTFGGTGVVLTDTNGGLDYMRDMEQAVTPLLQPDGKIVAVGYAQAPGSPTDDFVLVRYNIDGSLDTTFGSGGIARDAITSGEDSLWAAALQPDGKILAAGSADTFGKGMLGVARFNPDGTLDSTFGTGGNVTLTSPSRKVAWRAYSIAVQADGKILLGTSGVGAVVRLNANGSLDSTFGNGGKVTFDYDTVAALTTQRVTVGTVTEERILVVRESKSATGGQNSDFLVMRLMPNGTVDTSFGPSATGLTYTDFCGGGDRPTSMAVDAAGNIVVAGGVDLGSGNINFGIARYTSGGIPDPAFGDPIPGSAQRSGRTRVDFFGSDDGGWGVVVQPDGKLVMGGTAQRPVNYLNYFGLARFNPDGTLDTSFGTGGVVASDYSVPAGGSNFGHRLVLAADGRIILVGSAVANGTYNFVVARYWP
jgi:uncharacterized delta-60 repeat protein